MIAWRNACRFPQTFVSCLLHPPWDLRVLFSTILPPRVLNAKAVLRFIALFLQLGGTIYNYDLSGSMWEVKVLGNVL